MADNMLTPAMSLSQLLPTDTLTANVASIEVVGLSIDSRDVAANYAFIAVRGIKVHGKNYIEKAIQSGAVVILIDATDSHLTSECVVGIPVIALPLLESRLSEIASRFYAHPSQSLRVVGVTGTNGKTTISQLYAQLSALMERPSGVVGTIGYGVCAMNDEKQSVPQLSLIHTGMTTPDAIRTQKICAELLASGSENIVMEVSSHGLHQGRVSAIDFDVAVFSNLSHDHLDYHGDMKSYAQAKAILFEMDSVSSAVINVDDAFSGELINTVSKNVTVITYSLNDSQADIYFSNIEYSASKTRACLHISDGESYSIETTLVGAFNLSNLLAVIAAFVATGMNSDVASDRLAPLSTYDFTSLVEKVAYLLPVSGRMEAIANEQKRQVIVDYAHTPDALKNVLAAIKEYAPANVVCVFGCGGDRDKEKRALMASIAETYADQVFVTSDNPRHENPSVIIDDICKGFSKKNHRVIEDRQQAISVAIENSAIHDVILIAGKGHEDYQIVGDAKLSFSDQHVARIALRHIASKSTGAIS